MAMSDDLILLEFWSSPYVARVKIALKEKNITNYETKHEDVIHAKSTLLFEVNPIHKKVPVLIHNGKPICESLIIVEYIDEVWNDRPSLLPVDPFERARARFWADYNDRMFFNFVRKIWRQKEDIEQEEKKEFISCLKLLEGELGNKPYFGGDTFGYLDVALIPNYCWFYTYETFTKLNIASECPKLIAWAKRCMERSSVKESLPNEFEIYNYALELKKLFGGD